MKGVGRAGKRKTHPSLSQNGNKHARGERGKADDGNHHCPRRRPVSIDIATLMPLRFMLRPPLFCFLWSQDLWGADSMSTGITQGLPSQQFPSLILSCPSARVDRRATHCIAGLVRPAPNIASRAFCLTGMCRKGGEEASLFLKPFAGSVLVVGDTWQDPGC